MPPAAGGLSPRTPDLENNDACWRAEPRARASLFSPSWKTRFQRGSAPFGRRKAFFLSLLLNVYATVACRRRLQKAPRQIHERLPRTHSRPAQGLGQRPQARLGHARSRQRQKPAPGPRGIWMRSEKAELYLLEGRKMPPAAGAQPPRTPTWKTMTPVGARKPRANRRHCFPQAGFQRGSAFGRRQAFFLFAS